MAGLLCVSGDSDDENDTTFMDASHRLVARLNIL